MTIAGSTLGCRMSTNAFAQDNVKCTLEVRREDCCPLCSQWSLHFIGRLTLFSHNIFKSRYTYTHLSHRCSSATYSIITLLLQWTTDICITGYMHKTLICIKTPCTNPNWHFTT